MNENNLDLLDNIHLVTCKNAENNLVYQLDNNFLCFFETSVIEYSTNLKAAMYSLRDHGRA